MIASTIQLTLMRKDKEAIELTMILVPIFFKGHIFAVQFVTGVVS